MLLLFYIFPITSSTSFLLPFLLLVLLLLLEVLELADLRLQDADRLPHHRCILAGFSVVDADQLLKVSGKGDVGAL